MLNAIPHELTRRTLGNVCLASVGLAIHGTNTENVLTANAVALVNGGLFNAFAAQTEIDISGKSFFDAAGDSITAPTSVPDGYTCKFVLAANSADAIVVICGKPILTSQGDDADWPILPDGYAPFGGIKVGNASGAAFVIGTTDLDAAGITDTYYNLMTIPERAT